VPSVRYSAQNRTLNMICTCCINMINYQYISIPTSFSRICVKTAKSRIQPGFALWFLSCPSKSFPHDTLNRFEPSLPRLRIRASLCGIGIFRTMDPAPQLRVACAGCHPCSVYVTRSTSKRCLEDPLSKVGGNSRFYHDYCATRTDDLREWPLHELTAWSCSSHQSIYISL